MAGLVRPRIFIGFIYMKFIIRSNYQEASRMSDVCCETPSLTQQCFRDEMDINVILQRCLTGDMSGFRQQPGSFLDVSQLGDFSLNMQNYVNVKNYFEALPAEVRAKFNNDLKTFTEVASNPENAKTLKDLGLLPPDPVDPTRIDEPKAPNPDPKDQQTSPKGTVVD